MLQNFVFTKYIDTLCNHIPQINVPSSVVKTLFSAASMCAWYRNRVGIYFSAHVTQTQCSPVIIDAVRGVAAAYGHLLTIHINIRPRLD